MPALPVSTMPSGSTRLTVTFLYSFPASVLKSSATASEMKDRLRKVRDFICMLLIRSPRFQNIGFRVKTIPGSVECDSEQGYSQLFYRFHEMRRSAAVLQNTSKP